MKTILTVTALMIMSSTAQATDDSSCEQMTSVEAKLACYRAENKALRDELKTLKGEYPVRPAKQTANAQPETEKSAPPAQDKSFGEESIPDKRKTDEQKSKDTKKIDAKLVDVYASKRGGIIAVLDNGQVWRQLNSDNTKLAIPRNASGLKVEIKKTFMGGFRMTIERTGRTIKVSRLK